MAKKPAYHGVMFKHSELTEEIIGGFFAVYNALGYGFLEKVYAIVEVKATKTLLQKHEAQLLNYLKATPFEVGLLLNFGPKPEQKRRSFDNNRKEWWLAEQSKS